MSDHGDSRHAWVLRILGIDILQRAAAGGATAGPATLDPAQANLGAPIKRGQFGLVNWLTTTQPGVPPLVMKTPLTAATRDELQRESDAYAKVGDHPNIAKCYGMQTVGDKEGLVLEGIKGRDMSGTMKVLETLRSGNPAQLKAYGMTKQLSQEEFTGVLQYMTMQMLSGMAQIEQAGVVHCDIRPDNIMIDQTTGEVKIVDFGISQDAGPRPDGQLSPIKSGSVSPDIGHDAITPKHDMFGLGEAVRKPMERGQFDYQTGKPAEELTKQDATSFGTDTQRPAQALNKADPNEAALAPFEARLAPLQGRAEKMLAVDNGWMMNVPAGQAIPPAVEDAKEALVRLTDVMKAGQADAMAAAKINMDTQLATLGEVVEGAEKAYRAFGKSVDSPQEARLSGLHARLKTLAADPFFAGTDTGKRLQAKMRAADRLDGDGQGAALDELDSELEVAERSVKKSGETGADTAYTRFVNMMMHPDPAERPSASELLAVIQTLDAMDEEAKTGMLDKIDPIKPDGEPLPDGSSKMPVRFLAQRLGSDQRSRDILKTVLGKAATVDPPTPPVPVQAGPVAGGNAAPVPNVQPPPVAQPQQGDQVFGNIDEYT